MTYIDFIVKKKLWNEYESKTKLKGSSPTKTGDAKDITWKRKVIKIFQFFFYRVVNYQRQQNHRGHVNVGFHK